MDESIIWLMANGRKEQALKCIKRAAWWNNKDFETVVQAGYTSDGSCDIGEIEGSEGNRETSPMVLEDIKAIDSKILPEPQEDSSGSESDADGTVGERVSFVRVLRNKTLFINSVAMWVTWFSASLCYFTLYLMVSSLAGDKYLNYTLTSLMDVPACFIFFFGFNRYGRRSVTILLYSILAIGTFALGLLRHFTDDKDSTWSVVILITSLISIVGGSGCFFSIFFYLPELFPTNVRNQATGFASCFARIGAMISPFMGVLAKVAIWVPGLVMCALASIAVFLLFLLPETKSRQLPQSLAEMESWFKKDKLSEERKTTTNALA
ncbi:organic cation transporter-like protein [Plakobranchus ocellatus]|uniref:Organic cation transporter-like protein n=1 Tax=Plakobranchus ocellatus TaxID=259542 RepID=A0AAV3ZCD0_9GAST|nr:organic cation transporter-like protein [Plakobranchus ocellatus]